jgi:hypothetical protein
MQNNVKRTRCLCVSLLQGEDVVKEDRKGGELEVGIYDL